MGIAIGQFGERAVRSIGHLPRAGEALDGNETAFHIGLGALVHVQADRVADLVVVALHIPIGDVREQRELDIVHADRLDGPDRARRARGVVARIGLDAHPARAVGIRQLKPVIALRADLLHRPRFVRPIDRVGLAHLPRVADVLVVHLGLRVIVACESACGQRGGRGRRGFRHRCADQRVHALGQDTSRLGRMRRASVFRRGNHLEVLAGERAHGIRVANKDFPELPVCALGYLPGEIHLVAVVHRRRVFAIIGGRLDHIAHVSVGDAFVVAAEVGSVVGKDHIADGDRPIRNHRAGRVGR